VSTRIATLEQLSTEYGPDGKEVAEQMLGLVVRV
jgi:hypothetical protein